MTETKQSSSPPDSAADAQSEAWWALPPENVLRRFDSSREHGLSSRQAAEMLDKHGRNRLPEPEAVSPFKIFLNQFNNFIVWVLIGAAGIAAVLQEWIDTGAILVIILLNAVLGFVQEFRAEKSLAALKQMAVPTCKIRRDGNVREIAAEELVPGDIVLLDEGARIPADGRLLKVTRLKTQEAALTGESMPSGKSDSAAVAADAQTGDRDTMVFMGTAVASGKGEFVVTATALGTELGKIAEMLSGEEDEQTPLQVRLAKLGKRLIVIFLVIVTAVFVLGLARGMEWTEMLLTALSLAVAAIPEGLPAVVTIALAIGVTKMAKRNALIRRLMSVETLGCATVICSDKTGTLTRNEMTVVEIRTPDAFYKVTGAGYLPEGDFMRDEKKADPAGNPDLQLALTLGAGVNGAHLKQVDGNWKWFGDPTEIAILTAGAKAGIEKESLEKENPEIVEIPFSSDRKRMSIARRAGGKTRLMVKGAPDVIIERCTRIFKDGNEAALNAADKKQIEEANQGFATKALRVLAVAYRDFEGDKKPDEADEQELVFAGLLAMIDPPRPEAKIAVAKCREAGIRPVMITGDHKATALAVARELGIAADESHAVDGAELDRIGEEGLAGRIGGISVYARVSPRHKLQIVTAWKKRGAVVAMTGDGVNDAPAIKEADIGVAMGITGTDVTKEAADMVVTDDNFASIVNAVEEGRGIYDNIIKFVKFLLAFNMAEILVLFTAMLIGFKDAAGNLLIPLSAVQILWMNLVTDGFPAIALALDPAAPHVMARKPRDARGSIFTRGFVADLILISILAAAGSLAACAWGARNDMRTAQTMTLTALVCLELVGVQMVRGGYEMSFFSNRWLLAALASSLLLQLMILYIPALNTVFGMVPLGLADWGVILGITAAIWVSGTILHRLVLRFFHESV